MIYYVIVMILQGANPTPTIIPTAPEAAPPNGAIFQPSRGYVPLTSGHRAGSVGDVLTVALVERTVGSTTATTGTDRNGSIGLTPPATGPLSLFSASDAALGGNSTFAGRGASSQANALSGEITVTVVEVNAAGMLRIEGTKQLRINRGNETVRVSGLIRPTDIGADNRVPSTRIADARIDYTGRGEVARASRQGWLQRFFSMISPF